MRWQLRHGDILDVPADVLICSANVFLNLSGGVGGAFLMRYGPAMQEALQQYLHERDLRHVERGAVIEMPPCGSPYRRVLHAVAVDALYESSPVVIRDVVASALERAAALSARTVSLAGLAMGYGRMSAADFAAGLKPVIERDLPPVEEVVIGLRSLDDVDELRALLPEIQ